MSVGGHGAEQDDKTREHHIALVREEDGETVERTLPSFVQRGDDAIRSR